MGTLHSNKGSERRSSSGENGGEYAKKCDRNTGETLRITLSSQDKPEERTPQRKNN
jgi:hypothetical protein